MAQPMMKNTLEPAQVVYVPDSTQLSHLNEIITVSPPSYVLMLNPPPRKEQSNLNEGISDTQWHLVLVVIQHSQSMPLSSMSIAVPTKKQIVQRNREVVGIQQSLAISSNSAMTLACLWQEGSTCVSICFGVFTGQGCLSCTRPSVSVISIVLIYFTFFSLPP